jgi:hypothetical protein
VFRNEGTACLGVCALSLIFVVSFVRELCRSSGRELLQQFIFTDLPTKLPTPLFELRRTSSDKGNSVRRLPIPILRNRGFFNGLQIQ